MELKNRKLIVALTLSLAVQLAPSAHAMSEEKVESYSKSIIGMLCYLRDRVPPIALTQPEDMGLTWQEAKMLVTDKYDQKYVPVAFLRERLREKNLALSAQKRLAVSKYLNANYPLTLLYGEWYQEQRVNLLERLSKANQGERSATQVSENKFRSKCDSEILKPVIEDYANMKAGEVNKLRSELMSMFTSSPISTKDYANAEQFNKIIYSMLAFHATVPSVRPYVQEFMLQLNSTMEGHIAQTWKNRSRPYSEINTMVPDFIEKGLSENSAKMLESWGIGATMTLGGYMGKRFFWSSRLGKGLESSWKTAEERQALLKAEGRIQASRLTTIYQSATKAIGFQDKSWISRMPPHALSETSKGLKFVGKAMAKPRETIKGGLLENLGWSVGFGLAAYQYNYNPIMEFFHGSREFPKVALSGAVAMDFTAIADEINLYERVFSSVLNSTRMLKDENSEAFLTSLSEKTSDILGNTKNEDDLYAKLQDLDFVVSDVQSLKGQIEQLCSQATLVKQGFSMIAKDQSASALVRAFYRDAEGNAVVDNDLFHCQEQEGSRLHAKLRDLETLARMMKISTLIKKARGLSELREQEIGRKGENKFADMMASYLPFAQKTRKDYVRTVKDTWSAVPTPSTEARLWNSLMSLNQEISNLSQSYDSGRAFTVSFQQDSVAHATVQKEFDQIMLDMIENEIKKTPKTTVAEHMRRHMKQLMTALTRETSSLWWNVAQRFPVEIPSTLEESEMGAFRGIVALEQMSQTAKVAGSITSAARSLADSQIKAVSVDDLEKGLKEAEKTADFMKALEKKAKALDAQISAIAKKSAKEEWKTANLRSQLVLKEVIKQTSAAHDFHRQLSSDVDDLKTKAEELRAKKLKEGGDFIEKMGQEDAEALLPPKADNEKPVDSWDLTE